MGKLTRRMRDFFGNLVPELTAEQAAQQAAQSSQFPADAPYGYVRKESNLERLARSQNTPDRRTDNGR